MAVYAIDAEIDRRPPQLAGVFCHGLLEIPVDNLLLGFGRSQFKSKNQDQNHRDESNFEAHFFLLSGLSLPFLDIIG
jgi:hypothetical protein